MTAPKGRSQPPRTYSKHGLTKLKGAVNALGSRAIDKRTALGKALAAWRADLVADLGGREAISTQQAAIIDLAVRTKLLLDSIDTWLLVQPSLINFRKRALLPVVKERQQLADALARYLSQLGTVRRPAIVATATVETHPDFPFLTPDEARWLKELQAKVDAGELDVPEFYRQVGPIFKAEQEARSRRNGSEYRAKTRDR